jgi:CRISPR system Cascade subunit CasC
LVDKLANKGFPPSVVPYLAEFAAAQISKIDSKKDAAGLNKVTTLCYLSEAEFESIATALVSNADLQKAAATLAQLLASPGEDDDKKKKIEEATKKCEKLISKGSVAKAIKSVQLKDAADIALFGRMVANDHSLTIEGAAMFSHALSTHKVDNEIDYFSAVDDRQPEEESGAGMTGTLEFSSATYYRFAALNLDMLKDADHLQAMTMQERQDVVKTFVRATLEAIPKARKTSMNGNVRPCYVLGIVRKSGHPVQLVNAFEKPVTRKGEKGLIDASIDALKLEYDRLNSTWGLNQDNDELMSAFIPEKSLNDFLNEVTKHVD